MAKHRKKKRGGFWTFVVVLLLLAGGGFAWLMLHFGEGPAQAWTRVVAAVQLAVDYFQPRPAPTPAPVTPAPTPAGTPMIARATPSETAAPRPSATPPDPLQWLLGHRGAWPGEIALKRDTLFPIVLNGARVGSGNVPAGSSVALKSIVPATRSVMVAYPTYGSEREVGIDATNLLELANVALRMPPQPTPGPAMAMLRPSNAAPLPVLHSTLPADRPAGYTQPSISVLVSDPAMPSVNQPIVELKDRGTTVLLEATPENFAPSNYAWKQVKDESNSYDTAGHADFSSAETSKPVVQVVLPEKGIYQFEVTATDRNQITAKTYVWVNVWDPVPALGPDHKVGRNPSIAPPTSVRMLSADPGPFHHPRVFFSWEDWAELSAKVAPNSKVPEARAAYQILEEDTQKKFDRAGSGINEMAQALLAYEKSGYAAAEQHKLSEIAQSDPELGKSSVLAYGSESSFPDALAVACYLAWLGPNPATKHLFVPHEQADRLTYLATLTAAFAKFQLGQPEACYGVALSYDLTYDWMTPQQQNDTRDYLFAIGNRYNGYGGGISPEKPSQKPPPGSQQNGGDFPNLSDGIILPALAIEGEEGKVSAAVRGDTGQYGSYTPAPASPASWPFANDCSVNNLQRQIRNNSEYMVTPWGFELNNFGYWQLGQNVSAPTALALARRGENQWVTTNIYQAHLAALYSLGTREADGLPDSFEQHDSSGFGNGDGSRNEIYLAKYMYPDDPMIDYIYRAATRDWKRNALPRAIFGAPLLGTPLEQVARAKKLELTKLDPMHGVAISRSGWKRKRSDVVLRKLPARPRPLSCRSQQFFALCVGPHLVLRARVSRRAGRRTITGADPSKRSWTPIPRRKITSVRGLVPTPNCISRRRKAGPSTGALLEDQRRSEEALDLVRRRRQADLRLRGGRR